jgi:glucosyl-3-phosphoglycerate phosphatase
VTDAADLVIWRHGRTEWNDTGRFQGHTDVPMDAVGHAQAAAAALALAVLAPTAIVSSDLSRASETAAYLGKLTGVPVGLDERLREIDVGEWSGLTRPEIEAKFPDTNAAWLRGEDVRREGGETLAEVTARATAALADALATSGDGPLVVVTHGGVSRALVLALLGLPIEHASAFAALGNARWAALVRRGSGWRLTAYNVGREPAATEPGRDDASAEPVL